MNHVNASLPMLLPLLLLGSRTSPMRPARSVCVFATSSVKLCKLSMWENALATCMSETHIQCISDLHRHNQTKMQQYRRACACISCALERNSPPVALARLAPARDFSCLNRCPMHTPARSHSMPALLVQPAGVHVDTNPSFGSYAPAPAATPRSKLRARKPAPTAT